MSFGTSIGEMLDAASGVARNMFGRVTSAIKGNDPNQVLTEADTAIGNLLIDQTRRI